MRALVAAAAVAALGVSAHAAVVISDFNTSGATGTLWQGWGLAGGAAPTRVANPTGGTGNWMAIQTQQYWGEFTMQSWTQSAVKAETVNNYDRLEFDVIFPSSWGTNTANVRFHFYSKTSGEVKIDDKVVQLGDVAITAKDTVQHFVVNYRDAAGFLPATTGAWETQFSINIFPGYAWKWDNANPSYVAYTPQTAYINNIQLTTVPEPTVIAGLAAASMGLMIRKRQK